LEDAERERDRHTERQRQREEKAQNRTPGTATTVKQNPIAGDNEDNVVGVYDNNIF